MKYEKLFTPIKIGNVEIKNRIAMAPMLMDFGQFDGRTTEQLMNYYEERAKGGTGLIITEITRVNDRTGASAFAQLGMSHDYQIEGMSELANRIHSHGAKIFVQLHHQYAVLYFLKNNLSYQASIHNNQFYLFVYYNL